MIYPKLLLPFPLSKQYIYVQEFFGKTVYLKLKWTQPTSRWCEKTLAKTAVAGFSLGAEFLEGMCGRLFLRADFQRV